MLAGFSRYFVSEVKETNLSKILVHTKIIQMQFELQRKQSTNILIQTYPTAV